MIKKYWLIPLLIWRLTPFGWAAEQKVIVLQFPCILEVEHFSIRAGRIINDQDAGNGKAVLSESLSFTARINVIFNETGEYRLTLYEKAATGDKDSVHIKINTSPDIRTYPHAASYGVYAPCVKTASFILNQPGNVTITLFTTNEFGSYYDKVVIDKIK
ncbi:MAG: hypothetical protein ACM3YE_14575 [Bacteroidota bacterium]